MTSKTKLIFGKVRAKFAPGTRLRDRRDGKVYVIGESHRTDFWLMDIAGGKKGTVSCWEIDRNFELEVTDAR